MTTPIYARGPSTTPFTLSTEFTSPLSEVLGATAEEAWTYSPLDSIFRAYELNEAQGDTHLRPEIKDMDTVSRLRASRRPDARVHTPGTGDGEFLSQEAANEQIKEAQVIGLKAPKGGITQGALAILIDRKTEELKRKDSIQRSAGGFWTGAAMLGTGLGISFLDPVNVASAFIPFVGPARYGALLKQQVTKLGRAGTRARLGAIEGAAGAALVEPIILTAAEMEQADYDMSDSLLNIAFGSVLGAGLHTGVGAFKDRRARNKSGVIGSSSEAINNAPMEIRKELGRSAVSQLATGRQVDVEVIGNFTPVRTANRSVFIPGKGDEVITPDVEDVAREMNPKLFEEQDKLLTEAKTLRRWLAELEQPREVRADNVVKELTDEIEVLDVRIDRASAKNRKRLGQMKDALERERAGIIEAETKGDTPDMVKVRRRLMEIDESLRDRAVETSDTLKAAKEKADASSRTIPGDEGPSFRLETAWERDPTPGVGQEIEATFSARSRILRNVDDAVAEPEGLAPDTTPAKNIENTKSEIEELTDELDALTERLGLRTPEAQPDFKAEDAAVADAVDLRKAFKVAASCMTGKG